jgi:hypothetical protein
VRTTLDIDDDVPPQSLTAQQPKALYGFRPFPERRGVVTNELIDKLREDDAY